MLRTKLEAIIPVVLEKKIFLKTFFLIYGHGSHFGYVIWTKYTWNDFLSPFAWKLHMKFKWH